MGMDNGAVNDRELRNMAAAVMPGTPRYVIEGYARLAERARTAAFGLIEDDVVVLDTETTGLSVRENELIEIAAARMRGRQVIERFDTFVHPHQLIPQEIIDLTSITNADVANAPEAVEAVRDLAEFVQGSPVIAHNAVFDRSFIESVRGGTKVSDIWIDSLALSRIALPRLASHKLADMADLFGCESVLHRANADVEALCGVWRILLCALADLPAGLMRRLAGMHPDIPWSYRPIFSYIAGMQPEVAFSLVAARAKVVNADPMSDRVDAEDIPVLDLPRRDEVEDAYAPGGLVSRMYPGYEPRSEQVQMAASIRDALATDTHRVIEAGTGVGKSIAYLVPLAECAKRNNITMGIATKSNNLADQLMYHELPKLANEMEDGLSYCNLKGYDHYPCLRKLEQIARGGEIVTDRDPADTLTAIAVIYAYACQSPNGDLDNLGIRWKSVDRQSLTTASRECARRLCPFFPDGCLVHGARRRAARADIVVTNHSLLFRNVAAEGKILPPIRHWVVDEAHSVEREARRQWALEVSSDDSKAIFERLGGEKTGVLGKLTRDLAGSDAATLFMGVTVKAIASVQRASLAMAEVFEALRDVARGNRARGGYEPSSAWISPDVRKSEVWERFLEPAQTAIDALDEAQKNLSGAGAAIGAEKPEFVVDVNDAARRIGEMRDTLKLVADGTDDRFVYSMQVKARQRAGGERLVAEQIDIGAALAEHWYPDMRSIIFASATMSVSGSFDHFCHSVGLDRLPKGSYQSLHLDSSYDFESNMAVVVASDVPDPRDREAYLGALERLLVSVHRAMGGSTLTLFTNRRDMEDLYERVQPQLASEGLDLACQLKGASTKGLRDHFIHEKSSSLFALKAFWEGFDASGETLRCVVIPKLPFSSPTEPLSQERDMREDRAWARYALPEAVLEVKQAAGRLIRTSTDRGVLVLADSRLVSKGYGKKFLNSLPTGYQRVEVERVGKYLELWRAAHERGGR